MNVPPDLPDIFCWTRFGTEAGEAIEDILARKELERVMTGNIFLWGIGNSVAPGIRALTSLTSDPEVLFSSIQSPPRQIDVSPPSIIRWTSGITLDGDLIKLPETVHVTSHGTCEKPPSRYALVCQSENELIRENHGDLTFGSLSNLVSGNKVGSSQVTAVVRKSDDISVGKNYTIELRVRLADPFFVRLTDPIDISNENDQNRAP